MNLRLPNSIVELSDRAPAALLTALGSLSDTRLHLDPRAHPASLIVERDPNAWIVRTETPSQTSGQFVAASPTDADLVNAAVGLLNAMAFDLDPGRLHLHAGCVEWRGAGILIAGRSGSGKSSTISELVRSGAEYLTDECLTLAPRSRTVFAYPKPITLKAGSDHLVQQIDPGCRPGTAVGGRVHIPIQLLGQSIPFTTLSTVVFVHHSSIEQPRLSPVPLWDALVRLLEDSFDSVRMGPYSLEVVAQALSGTSAWDLTYHSANDAAQIIRDLRPPLRPRTFVVHDLSAKVGPNPDSPQECTDRSTRSVEFSDGFAIFDGADRSLISVEGSAIGLVGPVPGQTPSTVGAYLPNSRMCTAELGEMEALDIDHARQALCTAAAVDALCSTDPAGMSRPSDVSGLAAQAHVDAQIRSAAVEQRLGELVDLLDSHFVPFVVLGGALVAADSLPAPYLRDLVTVEVLVSPTSRARIMRVLEHNLIPVVVPADFGSPIELVRHTAAPDTTMVGSRQDVGVSVFTGLAPGLGRSVGAFDELSSYSMPCQIGGRWYRGLHPTHRFIHACLAAGRGSETDGTIAAHRDVVLLAPRSPQALREAGQWSRRLGVEELIGQSVVRASAMVERAVWPPTLAYFKALR